MAIELWTLALAFFSVAIIYSSVGFGGGSSYIALLSLAGVPYQSIPIIGLLCNLIVTASGAWRFTRSGFFQAQLLWPFLVGAMPCSFIGGMIKISELVFFVILGISLVLVGIRLIWLSDKPSYSKFIGTVTVRKIGMGCLLGLISGLAGIGGGVFLSPLLMNLGWGRPKEIAAATAYFILINSAAGLTGQFFKSGFDASWFHYGPLFLAVLVGGQIGSRVGASPAVSPIHIMRITGVLTLIVGIVLLSKEGS